jgi:hypothetical protein
MYLKLCNSEIWRNQSDKANFICLDLDRSGKRHVYWPIEVQPKDLKQKTYESLVIFIDSLGGFESAQFF